MNGLQKEKGRQEKPRQSNLQINKDSKIQERNMAMNKIAKGVVRDALSHLTLALKALERNSARCAIANEATDEIEEAITIANSMKDK